MIALCLSTYERTDLLRAVFQSLAMVKSGVDRIYIVDDGSSNLVAIQNEIKIFEDLMESYQPEVQIRFTPLKHRGRAAAFNECMDIASWDDKIDILIHLDSDIVVEKSFWAATLATALRKYPELGLLSLNLPGHHLRLTRPGYDEVDFALGQVWTIPKHTYIKVKDYMGNGLWDQDLEPNQYECDACYRIRMLGYRVGILREISRKCLDTADWDRSAWSLGAFQFLRKWNTYFLGNCFKYKSPFMLKWDEFPLNYLFRKQVIAQDEIHNQNLPTYPLKDHQFEWVSYPYSPGWWLQKETKALVDNDAVLRGIDNFEDIDPALLKGERLWKLEDFKNEAHS